MRLKHYSLAEQVYNELLKQIIDGSREEGEKLSEETICKELGVSRTPAREALLMLVRDGLLERVPRCGCYVKKLDTDEISELFECRQMLECLALETGLDHISEQELLKLEKQLESGDDKRNSLDADEKMHELIISACPNRHLQELIRQLIQRTGPFRSWRTYDTKDIASLSAERKEILQAIRKRDKAMAIELLGKHIISGIKVFAENQGKRDV